MCSVILKQVLVLEKEEFGVTPSEETIVDQPPERRLAEIVSILVFVLRQPDLGQHNVQTCTEFDGLEQVGLVTINPRQLH